MPNQTHKVNIESIEGGDTITESTIKCECGFESRAFPAFVHAVVQRHIQMVQNDASLEIAKDF